MNNKYDIKEAPWAKPEKNLHIDVNREEHGPQPQNPETPEQIKADAERAKQCALMAQKYNAKAYNDLVGNIALMDFASATRGIDDLEKYCGREQARTCAQTIPIASQHGVSSHGADESSFRCHTAAWESACGMGESNYDWDKNDGDLYNAKSYARDPNLCYRHCYSHCTATSGLFSVAARDKLKGQECTMAQIKAGTCKNV
jgi:hypothetical protein